MTKKKLHLFVRARHLPKPRTLGVSRRPTTYAVISTVTGFGDILGLRRNEIGRTEVVWRSSSPEYATVIVLDYDERRQQQHRIAVDVYGTKDDAEVGEASASSWSHDGPRSPNGSVDIGQHAASSALASSSSFEGRGGGGGNSNKAELLAGVIFDVGTVLRSTCRTMDASIAIGSSGVISLQIDDVSDAAAAITTTPNHRKPPPRQTFKFHLRGRRLHNVRLVSVLDRPSYYFEVHRKIRTSSGDSWGLVYRSSIATDSLNPMWDPGLTYLDLFCNSDLGWPIRISILDRDRAGGRTLMGYFETTVAGLIDNRCAGAQNWDRNRAFAVRKDMKFRGRVCVVDAVAISGYERRDSPHLGNRKKRASSGSGGSGGADSPILGRLLGSSSSAAGRSSAQQLSKSSSSSFGGGAPRSPSLLSPASSPPESAIAATKTKNSALNPPPPPPRPTFDDYLRDGRTRIELCCAIDFTASNGDRSVPGTHHHLSSSTEPDVDDGDDDGRSLTKKLNEMNDYEFVIATIGSVVSKFAPSPSSHLLDVPVWGFGASFGSDCGADDDHDRRVYNIFRCGRAATVRGVEGTLDAYRSTFDAEPIFGDRADYGDVIRAAASRAEKSLRVAKETGNLSYTILLVITTGDERAFDAVKPRLDTIGGVPLSILFVCLAGGSAHATGLADAMDVHALEGGRAAITLVDCERHGRCSRSLARAAFEEIPEQVVDYFVANGL